MTKVTRSRRRPCLRYRDRMRPAPRAVAITCIVGLAILASAVAASAGDTPTAQGNVKHLHFELGPLDIRPGQNVIETNKFAIPQPKIDGWIVGFKPNLRLADGSVPPVDEIHLHHGVWFTGTRLDATALLPERFFGVGEEKTALHMPPGYGYRYTPSDFWWINYMIHNLTARPYKVSITYDVDIVPTSDAPPGGMKDVHPIWMDVQNGSIYPVFDVLKGSGTNGTFTYPDQANDPYAGGKPKNEWTVNQPGVLVHTFGHLHPGGLHVDLDLLRDGKDAHLFESTAKYYEPAGAVSWDVSMTATRKDWAVAVKPGDVLKISATYDTARVVVRVDGARGGLDVRRPGRRRPVRQEGRQARRAHPRAPPGEQQPRWEEDDLKDPTKVASGAATPGVNISDFLYGSSDLTARKPIATVAQGQSITFDNLDADGQKVWHSITACKAPCTATTGVAYPIADGSISFDSGQLGNAGVPTVGTDTWTTPADLPVGTYTYFCRVHPFMRGAFRVVSVS